MQSSVQKLGNDVVYVQKWPWAFGSDYPWWKYFNRANPSYKDYEELNRRADPDKVKAMAFEIDITGKTVKTIKSYNLQSLDVSDLKKGIYFLRIQSDAGNETRKIIVE